MHRIVLVIYRGRNVETFLLVEHTLNRLTCMVFLGISNVKPNSVDVIISPLTDQL